jgi:hypothetical protein
MKSSTQTRDSKHASLSLSLSHALSLVPSLTVVTCYVSAHHCRQTPEGKLAVAKGQAAFIKFIVSPLYDQLRTQLPFFQEVCFKCIQENVGYWARVSSEQQALIDEN